MSSICGIKSEIYLSYCLYCYGLYLSSVVIWFSDSRCRLVGLQLLMVIGHHDTLLNLFYLLSL